ncbi:hypothetical protein ISG33_15745 [Glaciecola sp. MH2013]|uniref:hypothetical protein n=1 Tax=Glaciecola sp. MH2013 TaxID=2785524 RepID=UPI00189E71DC|nr:hypothetical protein [Glaciecola sp. MH2013]MBF7074855.1 hypothetical protein [Glaciecola sp. MH2013]
MKTGLTLIALSGLSALIGYIVYPILNSGTFPSKEVTTHLTNEISLHESHQDTCDINVVSAQGIKPLEDKVSPSHDTLSQQADSNIKPTIEQTPFSKLDNELTNIERAQQLSLETKEHIRWIEKHKQEIEALVEESAPDNIVKPFLEKIMFDNPALDSGNLLNEAEFDESWAYATQQLIQDAIQLSPNAESITIQKIECKFAVCDILATTNKVGSWVLVQNDLIMAMYSAEYKLNHSQGNKVTYLDLAAGQEHVYSQFVFN